MVQPAITIKESQEGGILCPFTERQILCLQKSCFEDGTCQIRREWDREENARVGESMADYWKNLTGGAA